MKQLTPANTVNYLLVIFLSLYIFLGEFIVGTTHLGILKLALVGISALFFMLSLITDKITSLDIKVYTGVILILIIYIFWWGNEFGNYNLFVTILFGYILSKNHEKAILLFKIVFCIQFVAITYEAISHNFIYTEVASGLIKSNEYNFEEVVDLFEDSGFRTKGLFPGTLVASSFVIYFALIFRNNGNLLFFNMLMAFMVNGRLAILIASLTFLLFIFKSKKININNKKISNNLLFIISAPIVFVASIILIYNILPSTMLGHLLNTFDFTTNSNAGRLYRMFEGYYMYIVDYNLFQKMFGKPDYILFDFWGRPVPPEAEVAGILLEIGGVGLFIYFFALFKIYKINRSRIFNLNIPQLGYNFVVLMNLISMLEYRHCFGNVRGSMFWFLIWIAISEIKEKKSLSINSEKLSQIDT